MPDKREIEVSGVQLEDDRIVQADAIVCNADAAHLYEDLLEANLDDRKNKLEPSLSGFVIMLGVEGVTPGLEHHNIFFSSDYPLEFKRIFEDGQPAENPTIYVCISSKSDVSQAPTGMENWFVLVNAPPTGRTDWNKDAEAYARLILQSLAARGFDIRDRIKVQHIMTPTDLEGRYNTHRGGIYGSSSNTVSSAFLRPKNRARKVQGLYLASGSAHPGGGLPLVMLSGKLASDALEQDLTDHKI
jgi:phytoene desaturase